MAPSARLADAAKPAGLPRLVLFGKQENLFVEQARRALSGRGFLVRVYSRGPTPGSVVYFDGRDQVSADPSSLLRKFLIRLAVRAERTLMLNLSHYAERSNAAGLAGYLSVLESWLSGAQLARAAARWEPAISIGFQVLFNGHATSRSGGRRVLFPFGGDVFVYPRLSALHWFAVMQSLRTADLIIPSATTACASLARDFSLSTDRVRPFSWGVDLNDFPRRAANGVRPELTIMNLRRFEPPWGSTIVEQVFFSLAKEQPQLRFIIPGLSEPNFQRLTTRVATEALESRVLLFRANQDLEAYRRLLYNADIGVSLMATRDMRSASVLQAAACGVDLLLSDELEYRAMIDAGMQARIVPSLTPTALRSQLSTLIDENGAKRLERIELNRQFVESHEDSEVCFDAIAAALHRLVATPATSVPHCTDSMGIGASRRRDGKSD